MIINTVNTKQQQLENGYFSIGTGAEIILIVGSCRSVPYVNYFHEWSIANNNRFTVCFIDPFNWNYDLEDNRTDLDAILNSLETDERLLILLKSTKYFIHEHYNHYGMFSVARDEIKNIYKFGMKPELDICIPNFNDCFILSSDIITFDLEIRKRVIADWHVTQKVSEQTIRLIYEVSQRNLDKFYKVCSMSDIPQMKEFFANTFTKIRLFWTSNHVSKWFTLAVWKFTNDDFFHLDLSSGFDTNHDDMFANNFTHLNEIDFQMFDYQWDNEEVIPLQNVLFH